MKVNAVRYILLTSIVLCGMWLRLSRLDWDQGRHLHPDERAILFAAQNVALPLQTSDLTAPLTSRANPYRSRTGEYQSYPYGQFHLYLIVFTGKLIETTDFP